MHQDPVPHVRGLGGEQASADHAAYATDVDLREMTGGVDDLDDLTGDPQAHDALLLTFRQILLAISG
ncbi:hypothetical protein GCM10009547_16170 [Sporichthya brevicatena]|uniref:Uncharacterized protein n=1 Tax=Sporichthya brevicatena TaxID=171442 RepID=A0ABN1GN85_9ACTN